MISRMFAWGCTRAGLLRLTLGAGVDPVAFFSQGGMGERQCNRADLDGSVPTHYQRPVFPGAALAAGG